MKTRSAILMLLAVAGSLTAQTAKKATDKTASTSKASATKKTETEVINLAPIGLPVKMTVPKGTMAVAGPYSNSIKGPDNFEISVDETSIDVAAMKAKVEADKMTTFQKYLASDTHGFVYSSKIMSNEPCHFEYFLTIGGKVYRFYDKRNTPLTEAQVMPMYDAVKSVAKYLGN